MKLFLLLVEVSPFGSFGHSRHELERDAQLLCTAVNELSIVCEVPTREDIYVMLPDVVESASQEFRFGCALDIGTVQILVLFKGRIVNFEGSELDGIIGKVKDNQVNRVFGQPRDRKPTLGRDFDIKEAKVHVLDFRRLNVVAFVLLLQEAASGVNVNLVEMVCRTLILSLYFLFFVM